MLIDFHDAFPLLFRYGMLIDAFSLPRASARLILAAAIAGCFDFRYLFSPPAR